MKRIISVGRSSKNDIVISGDELISRFHLQLIKDDNGIYSVVDLNSKNGTYVNGKKISHEVILRSNDNIRIGKSNVPWQQYFENTPVTPDPEPVEKKSHKKVWINVIAAVALVVITILLYNIFTSGSETSENKVVTNNDTILVKDSKLEDELKIAYSNVFVTQQELVDAEQKLKEAKRLGNLSAKEIEDLEKQVSSKQKSLAEADNVLAQLQNKLDQTNKELQLTVQFYELIDDISTDQIQQVLSKLNKPSSSKESLKTLFNEVDNVGKQNVIDAVLSVIDDVKQALSNAAKAAEAARQATKAAETAGLQATANAEIVINIKGNKLTPELIKRSAENAQEFATTAQSYADDASNQAYYANQAYQLVKKSANEEDIKTAKSFADSAKKSADEAAEYAKEAKDIADKATKKAN